MKKIIQIMFAFLTFSAIAYAEGNPFADGYVQDTNPFADGYVQDKSVFGK